MRATWRDRVRRVRQADADQRGLTLPELLVSVVILGLIVGPLAAAMIFFLQNGETANRVFRDDSTARLAASYFTADVQSAATVVTTTAGQCGTGTPIATLRWTEGATSYASSWYAEATTGGRSLIRRQCTGSTVIVANDLGLLASATPTVACSPSCATPGTVTLTVTGSDGFAFTVNAAPRVTP